MRDYDPRIGAYKTQDPIGIFWTGPNRYGYVGGDPIFYFDLEGATRRCPQRLGGCTSRREHWTPYKGNSCFFHCCRRGYVEKIYPTPENPQAECFYDDTGKLTMDACGGSANDYPPSDPRHIYPDRGGVYKKGGPGLFKSLKEALNRFLK